MNESPKYMLIVLNDALYIHKFACMKKVGTAVRT